MPDTTALDAAELAAYRDGYNQLAWDPRTANSPHHTSYSHLDDEPTTHVQHTHNGIPAWLCAACTRITLTADTEDGTVCRGCGAVDTLGALLFEEPCTNEGHERRAVAAAALPRDREPVGTRTNGTEPFTVYYR